jgi:hypothetical protein
MPDLLFSRIKKNLTAEVAEHAEVEIAKCSGPECRGKSSPLFPPSWKMNTASGLPGNALCDLCLLFVHLFVLIRGGSKGKEESICIK